jgi:hypothetical protein
MQDSRRQAELRRDGSLIEELARVTSVQERVVREIRMLCAMRQALETGLIIGR